MTRKSDKLENERRKRVLSCFLDKNTDVLDIEKLKDSDYYTYHVYSEEAQNLLNSKVQDLINLDWCKERLTKSDLVGKILDIAYSLPPTIMLMLHNYDLIGVPPKVVVFSGDELVCSLEDSILLMLLKLCGFDIVAFSPAGYSIFSRYIRGELYNKLVVGPFNCNMIGVDFSKVKAKNKK